MPEVSLTAAPGDLARSPAIEPGSLRAWVVACRPATLLAALVPVLVGTACAFAAGGARAVPALAALAGALLLQIGTNLANDLFDHKRGADTTARIGPIRAVQAGLLTPAEIRRGMVVVFGLATTVGGYLVVQGGWPIVLVGVAAIAAAVGYTAGLYPLGYHGLGEPAVFLFFGFVAVGGSAFVQLGSVPALAWWAAIPVGGLATAMLVVNNLRDRETDAHAGKRTLAVRWGERAALGEYAALLAIAYAVPVGLVLGGRVGPIGLLPLATAPVALQLGSTLVRLRTGPALNGLLIRTARLLVAYGVLFAVGLALGA